MKTLDVVALVKDCPEEGLRRDRGAVRFFVFGALEDLSTAPDVASDERTAGWASRVHCHIPGLVKRSPYAIANWFIAARHSLTAWARCSVMLRSANQTSLVAASSLGK